MLSTTFSVTEIPPQRDSAKSQLLRLYTQFSFTKILKALYTDFHIYNILEERPKALLKMFLIDVDRLTFRDVLRTSFSSIFFKMHFYIVVFPILTIGKHIDMEVCM